MSIEIANESGEDVDESRLVHLAAHVLAETGIDPGAELSLLLVDVETMTELHVRWMDEPGPTDVLSFPMDELGDVRGPGMSAPAEASLLGDVVLCPVVAAEQATAAGHSAADELALLCTHGILHLLGYDHAEDDEREEMFGLQKQLLTSWRRPDPAGTR